MGSLHHYRRSQRRAHGCRRVKKARDDTAHKHKQRCSRRMFALQEASGGQMRAAVVLGRGGKGQCSDRLAPNEGAPGFRLQ
jgi:hypothetical protein